MRLWIAVLVLLCALSLSASAQSYPDRPVHVIVGGAAGSVPDALARPVAERLSTTLGQPVIVENRPGAAGIIGMEALTRSRADGYTLAVATMSQAVFNAYLFAKLPYDPQRDLQPVAPIATGAMVVAAHPSFPARSFADLVALAKREPGRLFMAMPQNGSPPHVVALLLQRAAGIDVAMVPHKSGADAVSAVLANEIPLIIEAPTLVAPHVKSGRLKALVVTGTDPEPELPDVPTMTQSGFPGVRGEAWIGIVAPKGTPGAIVERLNREIAAVVAMPDMQAMLRNLSFRPLQASPQAFAKMIDDDHATWSTVIRAAGLRLD